MARPIAICSAAAIVGVVIPLFVVPLFLPWSPINCRYEEVDITTGRLRFSRYLFYCKVSERIEETALSKMLPEDIVSESTPQWRKVNTFSVGCNYSPHHQFHSAIVQIRFLSGIWEMSQQYGLTDSTKRAMALHVLALWQHDGSDRLAAEYISVFSEMDNENIRRGILDALPTLQMPLIETNESQVIRTMFFPNGNPMEQIHGYDDDSGKFIRHGIWQRWRPDGTKSIYGHFENGDHHGKRFEWDQNGKLIVIEAFDRGKLSECEMDNLQQHPDHEAAQEAFARE